MTPQRHQKSKEIFLEACPLDSAARAVFLDAACAGEPDLRRHLETLLKFHAPMPVDGDAGHSAAEVSLPCDTPEPSSIESFTPGRLIGKRFRIVSMIGRGAMGCVYRADDIELGQPVALKFLLPSLAFLPGLQARLRAEVRLAREVTHPNICRTFDLHEEEGFQFISMEFVDGEDLGTLLRRVGRPSADRAAAIARELCTGIGAAHRRGVLHRDLKPANIMIDAEGRVRLTDFGLAASVGKVHGLEIRAGTPRYMAPEQISGESVTVKSDLYSLGLVLYEVFTGHHAFEAASVAEYVHLHRNVVPPPPASHVPGLGVDVDRAIMACIEKDPAARPESALDVVARLTGIDLLSAAVKCGEILDPQMIADSAEKAATSRSTATAWLIAFLALLACVVALARNAHPISVATVARPPSFLLDRARRAAALAGMDDNGHNVACGFISEMEARRLRGGLLVRTKEPAALALGRGLHFYYRASLSAELPVETLMPFVASQRSHVDLAQTGKGEATILLAPDGRLVSLESVLAGDGIDNRPPEPDLIGLLEMAGAKGPSPATVEALKPNQEAGTSGSWDSVQSTYLADQDLTIVARYHDRTLAGYSAIRQAAPADDPARVAADESRRETVLSLRNAGFLLVLCAALPAAWRNWKRGGDLRGAVGIGLVVFVARLLALVLSVTRTARFEAAVEAIAVATEIALCEGFVVAIFYLALEMHVRRVWPHTLVGWSRGLLSKTHDPIVGRDILTGAALGAFWAVLVHLDHRLPQWAGWEAHDPIRIIRNYDYLLGGRFLVADSLDLLRVAIYFGLFVSLILVLGRVMTHRRWAAILVATVITMILLVPAGTNTLTSLAFGGLGLALTIAIAAVRYGLLTLIVGFVVTGLFTQFPLTTDPQSWYFGCSLFAALIALAIVLYGFVLSRLPMSARLTPHPSHN